MASLNKITKMKKGVQRKNELDVFGWYFLIYKVIFVTFYLILTRLK